MQRLAVVHLNCERALDDASQREPKLLGADQVGGLAEIGMTFVDRIQATRVRALVSDVTNWAPLGLAADEGLNERGIELELDHW